ncbi:DUF192 domain-containing protein [Pontibaca salina]|uniref:DUF192 domain-containing protein n=1 Tax=Pontibaca salina TaxID=2795731 RepID=A0A934LZV9_9RHOB|nr:DUF192 domain-containing protein [Pontibaca salina]MBI6629098.1 DUF192 domain-containing protein [Pontibaca salina]
MTLRLILVASLALLAGPGLANCRDDVVALRGDWGQTQFSVEVVDTAEGRARGLMFRETMPRGAGMLFAYDSPQPASFWMKNTLLALDILFADRTGTITHVHHNAQPGDLTPVSGGQAVFAVLEINGGLAQDYGIKSGTEMQHPAFRDGLAAWPCEKNAE